ncbi:hypothetical protein IEO21_06504 [Rhodonia placenta]|uniref:Uncharacterized protein n=1 Tax=Rhodonia placenta TaxID=104341 RepID=A0A8H7P060_9APHY|nr:hypothetical protein IEO21_06504 [Postia placenta]
MHSWSVRSMLTQPQGP